MSTLPWTTRNRARGADAVAFLRFYDCPITSTYLPDTRRAVLEITLTIGARAASKLGEIIPWAFTRFITDNPGPKRTYVLKVIDIDMAQFIEVRDVLRDVLLKGWCDTSTYATDSQTGTYSAHRAWTDQ